ncbi:MULTISPECIES: hypothetical protein [Corallococcus]|uniref:hypothetical protein n=1 Tax=Corallococcus TaxID=83461 RepID=UPI001F3DE7C5|nr:hypothetical protein [Corallococcus sp. AB032C]
MRFAADLRVLPFAREQQASVGPRHEGVGLAALALRDAGGPERHVLAAAGGDAHGREVVTPAQDDAGALEHHALHRFGIRVRAANPAFRTL